MMRKIFYIVLWLAILFGNKQINAQKIQAGLKLSDDTIIIGAQTQAELVLIIPHADDVIFPTLKDTLTSGLEILKIGDLEHSDVNTESIQYMRSLMLTAFDTGLYVVPPLKFSWIVNVDTFDVLTDTMYLQVQPFIDVDTIPRDTVFASHDGFAIFGKNSFIDEVNQSIPDSVRQSLNEDQLKSLQDSVFMQYAQRFASNVFNSTGLKDQEEISLIISSPVKQLFIADKRGISEQMRVPGAIDTLFVNEFDTIMHGDALYVALNIQDIEDTLYNTPLTFKELWYRFLQFLAKNWWWLLIVITVLVVGLYYFLRKRGVDLLHVKQRPEEPPHIVAFRELERIRIEKIWHNGKVKEYYTQITDTIRKYIGKRFGVYAMEMTTEELMIVLEKLADLNVHNTAIIRQVLELADLVKFARAEPLTNEHDRTLKNAYEFVENTLEVEENKEQLIPVDAVITVDPESNEKI